MPVFRVHTGVRYRAHIALGFFESFADNETVGDRFREVGFEDVVVTGSGDQRIVEGTWTGKSAAAEMPEQVQSVVAL